VAVVNGYSSREKAKPDFRRNWLDAIHAYFFAIHLDARREQLSKVKLASRAVLGAPPPPAPPLPELEDDELLEEEEELLEELDEDELDEELLPWSVVTLIAIERALTLPAIS